MKFSKHFRVEPNTKVKLHDFDPDFKHQGEEAALLETKANDLRLRELQEVLYAEHKHAVLICLQAIDTGGKDGTISHVMGAMNPQGCRVSCFKEPTTLERDHDFMWRAHRDAPGMGEIVIFNRSHYEDVLTARVHSLVPKKIWSKRYDQINSLESFLVDNGTHILKFFLYIDKDEQKKRLQKRLDDPKKQWKVSLNDFKDHQHWDEYKEAFESMLSKCSTEYAPWFVIPANHKWFRNLAISQILVEYLESLDMKYPPLTVDIEQIRKTLNKF